MKRSDNEIPSAAPQQAGPAAGGDMLNKTGAMALAKRLEKYWRDQGYPAARFWPEPVVERFAKVGTYEVYRVVCNLVNGMPPRYVADGSSGRIRSGVRR